MSDFVEFGLRTAGRVLDEADRAFHEGLNASDEDVSDARVISESDEPPTTRR
jgi:hypothetical protein